MTREELERQIQELLATEADPVALSNALFSQSGLFALLAITEEERRILTQSSLFREANQRVMEMELEEAQPLLEATEKIKAIRAARKARMGSGSPATGSQAKASTAS